MSVDSTAVIVCMHGVLSRTHISVPCDGLLKSVVDGDLCRCPPRRDNVGMSGLQFSFVNLVVLLWYLRVVVQWSVCAPLQTGFNGVINRARQNAQGGMQASQFYLLVDK